LSRWKYFPERVDLRSEDQRVVITPHLVNRFGRLVSFLPGKSMSLDIFKYASGEARPGVIIDSASGVASLVFLPTADELEAMGRICGEMAAEMRRVAGEMAAEEIAKALKK